jgi:pyridinium-3,5-biscarboxylic acid mononucleotide sulfurtransferase
MQGPVTLFNGTNKEDRRDPTRVGLKAAADFQVRSPIDQLTKAEVRALARALGLPNWRHAASPCLRSRLALGVPALEDHLRRVERAEGVVRRALGGAMQVQHNLRVRLLAGGRGAVELDAELLHVVAPFMAEIEGELRGLGFDGGVTLRAFKSGSVSTGDGGGVVVHSHRSGTS